MSARGNILFHGDGRFVVLPVDHGQLFGALLAGLERPDALLQAAIEGGADAVLCSYGILKHYSPMLKGRVKTILRLDGGPGRYSQQWMRYTDWRQLFSVETAAEMGADAVAVMVFPGISVETDTAKILAGVAEEAGKVSMPVVAEVLPCPVPAIPDIYDARVVADATRFCFDLGADIVKTLYTGSPESFRRVTDPSPIPVGVAGGERMDSVRDVLEVAKGCIDGGGAGVFFGRNVWQREDPAIMLRALKAIVHEGSSVEAALSILSETEV